jgi:CheY-like chemotaxis protein
LKYLVFYTIIRVYVAVDNIDPVNISSGATLFRELKDKNEGTEMNTDLHTNTIRGLKVLLVDDEKMVLEVGKAILQRLGHEVVTAESGEEALTQFSREPESIGCVVLDLTMPGMDGKAAFKALRELSPKLPIIIASGMAADQVAGQFVDMPPTSVIQKPYQIADLSASIQRVLKGHPSSASPPTG